MIRKPLLYFAYFKEFNILYLGDEENEKNDDGYGYQIDQFHNNHCGSVYLNLGDVDLCCFDDLPNLGDVDLCYFDGDLNLGDADSSHFGPLFVQCPV
jgi:hypothetical protein